MLQVRDVLKGTLKFSRTLLDETDDVTINVSDDHYNMEVTRSPDSETSPEGAQTSSRKNRETSMKDAEKRRMFYMSSEENSEAMESPSDPNVPSSGNVNSFKLPIAREFEMSDYNVEKSDSCRDNENRLHSKGPNFVESELSKSWSPDSERTSSLDSEEEESPNPLYRIRHGSYNT